MVAYFDNSATTKVCQSAKEEILNAIENCWGNPSSLHENGINASELLLKAQNVIAKSIGCKADEVIFTSGGTQSNNLAIFGATKAKQRLGKKVITTSIEHSSVMESFKELETMGFDVHYVSCNEFGEIDVKELESLLDESTIFVSTMLVNNEVGSVTPIEQIAKLVRQKAKNATYHVDAVQAFGKMPINLRKLDVDLMSISAHKVHGPKGAGALFVKSGTKMKQTFFGGEQGKHIRAGTEPMPAIAGFMGAVLDFDIDSNAQKVRGLNQKLRAELKQIPQVRINSSENASDFVLNISLEKRRSETVLNFLSDMNIFVSSGSACAKGHKSHVLSAMNLSNDVIDSAIRISFCKDNTEEELEYLVQNLKLALKVIRSK